MKVFIFMLILTQIYATISKTEAADLDCRLLDPRQEISREIKTDVQGFAKTLFKIGQVKGDLDVKYRETVKTFQDKYPTSDQLVLKKNLLYFFCAYLNSSHMTQDKKNDLFKWVTEKLLERETPKSRGGKEEDGGKAQTSNTLPALDIFVDQDKILHIKNIGQVSISDIQIFMTRYTFKAHTNERNHFILDEGIDSVSTASSAIAKKAFLSKGGAEYKIPLTDPPAGKLFSFISFEELTALDKDNQLDLKRTVYCLRILFRNEITKQRQVYYLLTNAMKQFVDEWDTRSTASGGSYEGSVRLLRIRDLIKEHQANYYGDHHKNFYKNL